MSKQSTSGNNGGGVGGGAATGGGSVGGENDEWRGSLNGGERSGRKKPGILRLDISKPSRSSGGSVEFRAHPEMLGEDSILPSGQTSPHQLSVTWASQCDLNDPDSKAKQMLSHLESTTEKSKRLQEDKSTKLSANPNCPPLDAFGGEQQQPPSDDDDDEEYSVSVSAIMQKRASIRGNRKRGSRISRRASSPMDHILDAISQSGERRRSSVYTTSSGDTAISVDDGTNQDSTQEQIFENIRLHKEVIQSVKLQPWSIRKKLKLVRQAKTYVARHEGALQERFALSRSLRDLWARFKILMAARWKHWKRETSSFLTVLIPWELRIKEIESHFGSGVASYFTFLRWLLWVNIMMMIPLISFVIAPEVLSTSPTESDPRKNMSSHERAVAGNFFTFWEFEGYLKYSPLFYGYYSNQSGAILRGYNLPLAYFLTAVAVYVYSFFATLRKMAENSRNSKLSSKDDECIFSWKLFTGWDFMIGHAETAHNRIASVVVGFKEALLEEAEKKKDKRNWRIILQRILVNILVLGLLAASGYTVVSAVDRSERVGAKASWFRRNEVNVIMTMLSFVLPMIFDALGLFENWHPRQQLRLQLARIMILNLLNLYSLMFSFIYKITGKDERLQSLKSIDQNATIELEQVKDAIRNLTTITTTTLPMSTPSVIASTTSALAHYLSQKRCFNVPVNCSVPKPTPALNLTTSMLLLNLSTTMLPSALWTDPTTHRLMTTTPFEEVSDFLTSTTSDPMPSPSSTTGEDGSTSSTPFYSTSSYSTSPPPLSTTLEDYRSDFNDTFFDYYDYFENIGSKENNDPEAGGRRERRAIVQFADTMNNTSTSDVISSETTEYSTASSSWDSSTDSSSTFSSSTDTTDEQYPIGQSSSTTISAFIDTITDIVNSTETDSVRDKVLEFITTVTTSQPDIESLNLTTITSTNPIVSTTMSYAEEEVDEESCMITICVTLPPYLYNTPPTTELVELSKTEPTNVSIINSLPPAQQLMYYEGRAANLSRVKEIIRRNLTTMCWETSLGQELSKVIVFDTMMSIAAPLCIDFLRALFVRYMNKYWCWDMEKTFPQYGDFKIAESILNLVYNQGQVWMGIFFSPGLVIINFVKLMILMYLRSWIVLTCNVPHEVVFKASKSNNFYLSLLLTMLFLCVLPVGYAIVWLRPSWHCGPFSDYDRISEFFTTTIIKALPLELHKPLEYLTSPSTVIPLLLLLTLIIYYLVSLTGALREANQDLRNQLVKEREEERKKMFKIPETKGNEQAASALTTRWRKVLDASSPLTPPGAGQQPPDFDEAYKTQARKELLARIMKKALRKGSATSDDDSFVRGRDEDDTDTEHHESLPHDEESKEKMFGLSKLQNIRRTRKPSLVDIVQIARSEQNKARESHPRGRFRIDKISKPDTNIRPEKIVKPEKVVKTEKVDQDRDNDPDTNSRVVSERRQSLLRKQAQVQEVDPTPVKPSDHPEAGSKFAVIDEKTSDTLKKQKRKTPQPNSDPEVFKFDEKSVDRNRSKQNLKSPEPPKKDVDSGERKKQSEAQHDEEKPDSNKHEKFLSFSKQGRKTIGNFMTLMREAVKKVEQNSPNGDTAPTKTSPPEPVHSRPSTSESEAKVEPQVKTKPQLKLNTELKFNSKPELEKQTTPNPISQSAESAHAQPESFDSEEDDKPGPTPPPVRSGSLRWAERPTPTREDSQTSVWSDNIPTITISTTGSDDCIVEPNGNNENTITNGDDA